MNKEATNKLNTDEEIILFKLFNIKTNRSDEFIDKLERICEEFSVNKDYFFSFEVEG